MEGSVNVISPDGNRVLKTLEKGSYVGELALISNSRRMCSVVANTLTLVYSLQKSNFEKILKNFPDIRDDIRTEAEKRNLENDTVLNTEIGEFTVFGEPYAPEIKGYKRRPHY